MSPQLNRSFSYPECFTHPNDAYLNCGNFSMKHCITSLICRASSRVGVITKAPTCAELQRWNPVSSLASSAKVFLTLLNPDSHLHLLQLLLSFQKQFNDRNDKSQRLSTAGHLQTSQWLQGSGINDCVITDWGDDELSDGYEDFLPTWHVVASMCYEWFLLLLMFVIQQ